MSVFLVNCCLTEDYVRLDNGVDASYVVNNVYRILTASSTECLKVIDFEPSTFRIIDATQAIIQQEISCESCLVNSSIFCSSDNDFISTEIVPDPQQEPTIQKIYLVKEPKDNRESKFSDPFAPTNNNRIGIFSRNGVRGINR
jgi:hypothetical protein